MGREQTREPIASGRPLSMFLSFPCRNCMLIRCSPLLCERLWFVDLKVPDEEAPRKDFQVAFCVKRLTRPQINSRDTDDGNTFGPLFNAIIVAGVWKPCSGLLYSASLNCVRLVASTGTDRPSITFQIAGTPTPTRGIQEKRLLHLWKIRRALI